MRRIAITLGLSTTILAALIALGGCNKAGSGGAGGAGGGASANPNVKKVAASEIVGKRVDVTASDDGFKPNDVRIKKGEATTLVFTRTSKDTCADAVVIKDLNIKKDLPLDTEVAIPIPAGDAKTYGFECGMGMYKSKIVVE